MPFADALVSTDKKEVGKCKGEQAGDPMAAYSKAKAAKSQSVTTLYDHLSLKKPKVTLVLLPSESLRLPKKVRIIAPPSDEEDEEEAALAPAPPPAKVRTPVSDDDSQPSIDTRPRLQKRKLKVLGSCPAFEWYDTNVALGTSYRRATEHRPPAKSS